MATKPQPLLLGTTLSGWIPYFLVRTAAFLALSDRHVVLWERARFLNVFDVIAFLLIYGLANLLPRGKLMSYDSESPFHLGVFLAVIRFVFPYIGYRLAEWGAQPMKFVLFFILAPQIWFLSFRLYFLLRGFTLDRLVKNP